MSTKPTLDERLERIPKKLLQLAAADERRDIFGAWQHQYRLNPCLPESTVAQFEAENQVQLPVEYRAFLLQVGDGGAGPHIGMYPLGKCLEHLSAERNQVHPELPFPHTSRWCPFDEWEEMGKPQDLLADYEQEVHQDHHVNGSIVLSGEGCGMLNLLVLNGQKTGNVWKDDRCNEGEIYPLRLDTELTSRRLYDRSEGERISFLDWYENWLDCSFAKFQYQEQNWPKVKRDRRR